MFIEFWYKKKYVSIAWLSVLLPSMESLMLQNIMSQILDAIQSNVALWELGLLAEG